jgi:hypothetical protein
MRIFCTLSGGGSLAEGIFGLRVQGSRFKVRGVLTEYIKKNLRREPGGKLTLREKKLQINRSLISLVLPISYKKSRVSLTLNFELS